MNFWVYGNRVHNYVRVHEETCPNCNHGVGSTAEGRGPAAGGVGPYPALETARSVACATRACSH